MLFINNIFFDIDIWGFFVNIYIRLERFIISMLFINEYIKRKIFI